MTTLFRTSILPVPAETAWRRIAAIDKVHEIVPAIVSCTLDGDKRYCTFADGATLKERVISVDAALMRVAYTITESPFGMEYHSASMQVLPDAAGSRIVWVTDVKPDALKDNLSPLFDQLFSQLVQHLSAA